LWVVISLCLVVATAPAPAAVVYWKDTGTNDWSAGANWDGGKAPTVDIAGFRTTSGTAYAHPPEIANALAVGGIQVDDGSVPLSISKKTGSSGALTVGSGGINVKASATTGTVTIALPITLGGAQSWINDSTRADARLRLTGIATLNGSTLNIAGAGVTELSDDLGSITGSGGVTINSGGTLRMYNKSSTFSGDRIGNTVPITFHGGTLSFENDGSTAFFTETIGQVNITAGSSTIYASQAAADCTSTLTINSLTRGVGAAVDFAGAGLGFDARNRIVMPAQPAGFVGGWATCGMDWAKCVLSQPGEIRFITPFVAADYTSHAEAGWVDGDHVRLTGSLTTSGNRSIASLNLAQAAPTTLNLGGNTLTIRNAATGVANGGILASGSFNAQIGNGRLTSGDGANQAELIVTTNTDTSTVFFSGDLMIADNLGSSVSLTKSGGSPLVIQGANTYSGITTIAAGILRAENAAALGAATGGTIVFGGTTLQLNSANPIIYGAEPLTLNGMGSGGMGALNQPAGSANNTWSGPITLASDSRIGADGATTLTITGTVANGGNSLLVGGAGNTAIAGDINGGGPLIKDGAGMVTLSGSNNYAGGTRVDGGTLTFADAAALPPGTSLTVGSAGIVVFSSGFTGVISSGMASHETVADGADRVPEPGTPLLLAAAALCGLAAGLCRRTHLPPRAAG
jgi:fibronectin-binding autotransporter adhesin